VQLHADYFAVLELPFKISAISSGSKHAMSHVRHWSKDDINDALFNDVQTV